MRPPRDVRGGVTRPTTFPTQTSGAVRQDPRPSQHDGNEGPGEYGRLDSVVGGSGLGTTEEKVYGTPNFLSAPTGTRVQTDERRRDRAWG